MLAVLYQIEPTAGVGQLVIELDNAGESLTLNAGSSSVAQYDFATNFTFTQSLSNPVDPAFFNSFTPGNSFLNMNAAGIAYFGAGVVIRDVTTGTSVTFNANAGGSYAIPIAVTLDNSPGVVSVTGATTFSGSAGLSVTTDGNISVTSSLTTASSVALTSAAAISGSGKITANSLSLSAATGISVTTAVTTFSSITNSTSGAISISQTGAFAVPTISAPGNVSITASGDITVGNTITAAGQTVALDSTTGSINGASLITAGTVNLDAETGIGNTTALSLAASTISADSTAGKIALANALGTAVTVTSLTTESAVDPGGALITFNQSGGGTATFNGVSTVGSAAGSGWGRVTLVNNGGGITIASTGSGVNTSGTTSTILLVTTGSGSIAVNAPLDAGLNDGDVSVIAASAITGSGLMTGYTGSLVANTGIAANASVSQGFATITSAAGDINVTNQWGIAVPNAITAAGNVSLTSGQNISLSNPITATGKTVTLTANGGDIDGSSLITADTVDLNATTGIGTTGAVNLAAFFVSADTTAGAIDINNTSGTAASVTSLTTSGGAAIRFDQTGGGGIGIDGPVSTGSGTITLTSQQGIGGTGQISTTGTLDAAAQTGLSIMTTVTTFGTIASATGDVSIVQTGALDLPSLTLAAGGTLSIVTSGAITQQAGSVLTVPSGSASFAALLPGTDVILNESNVFGGVINVSASGTASVEINESGTTTLGTLSLGTGTLTVTTTGAITQTAAIVQAAGAGAATFETGGALITLTDSGNDFTGAVNLRNSGAKNISIVDSSGLILGAISQATTQANTLAVTVLAGNITQQAGSAISIGTGGATFTAVNGSDIVLDAASNAINGLVTFAPIVGVGNQLRNLTFTNGKAIQVPDGLNIAGDLVITASGNITDGTPFTVGGSSTFQTLSSTANISLTGDNQYNGPGGSFNLATVGSGSASVTGTTKAIALGTVTIGGTLTVETTDAVTDAGLIAVTGATSVKGESITLDSVGSTYAGNLNLESTGGNTTVSNVASAIKLGTVTVVGDLSVSGSLAITNVGVLTVSGNSSFVTTGNNASITLDGSAGGSASTFTGLVSFSANGTGSAALTNVTGPLGISTATFGGTFTLSATGTITADGSGGGVTGSGVGAAGAISITSSAGDIVLDEPIVSGGGNVTLTAVTGSVTSDAAGTITTTAAANTGSGSGFLVITAGTAINLQAAVSTSSSDNDAGGAGAAGNITFNAQSITVTQAITAIGGSNLSDTPGPAVAGSGGSAGAVTLTASNGAIAVADITATGGTGIKAVGGGGGSVLLQTTGGAGTIAVGTVTTTGGTGGAGFNSGNAGNIELDSDSAALVTLDGNLVAIGGSGVVTGSGGNIDIQDNAVITSNTLVTTGGTAGNVVFHSSVHSVADTPYSLTITAGEGNVTLVGEAGAPITGFLDNRLLGLAASGTSVTINKSVSTTGAAGIAVSASTSITIGNDTPTNTVVFNTNESAGGAATANGVVSLTSKTTTLTDNLTITRGTGAITFDNETLVGGDYDLTIDGTGTDTTGGDVSFQGDTSNLGDVTLSQVGVLVVGSATSDFFSSDTFIYTDEGTGSVTLNAEMTIQTSGGGGLVITTAGAITTNESISTPNAPITFESTAAAVTLNNQETISSGGTGNGPISITGVAVAQTNQYHTINAGSDKIVVDGNASTINLQGTLQTSYSSSSGGDYAILLRDATTVQFAAMSASAGSLQVGTAGGAPDVTGDVTQNAHFSSGIDIKYFAANTGANITVNASNNFGNEIRNLGTISLDGVLFIRDDAGGLNVLENLSAQQISVLTQGGSLALGTSDVTTTTGAILLRGVGVTQSAGSTIYAGSVSPATVTINGSDHRFGTSRGTVNLAGTIRSDVSAALAVEVVNAGDVTVGDIEAPNGVVNLNNNNDGGGFIAQTAGTTIDAVDLGLSSRGAITLGEANTIVNLTGVAYGGAVLVNDLGGLTLTGGINIWTGSGVANVTLTTTDSWLDVNGQFVRGDNVSLTGVGVKSTGSQIIGATSITIDAQDAAISLSGVEVTTFPQNGTISLLDASNVAVGQLVTNTGGAVVLGGAGGDALSGNVTQSARIYTGTLSGNVGGSVTLTNGSNEIVAVGNLTAGGAIAIVDTSGGLNVSGAVTNAGAGLVSLTTTGGGLAVASSGSITGDGVSLVNNNGGITIAGPINGGAGTVTLTAVGGFNAISQSGSGTITTTGALTGSSPGSLSLGLANELGQFGPFDVTGAASTLTVNDNSGGLSLAGNVTINTGALSITTAGGALALGANSITANAGSTATFSLTGVGITQSAGSTIDAGTGLIAIDANGGNIVMAGVTDTSSANASAIVIRDAGTVQLGTVTGSLGTVTIGVSGDITGAVTQVGPLAANKLVVNTAGSVNLATDSGNTIDNLNGVVTLGNFSLRDSTLGLILLANVAAGDGSNAAAVSLETLGGSLQVGAKSITAYGNISLQGAGITQSAGSAINANAGDILMDGDDGTTEGGISLLGTVTTTSNSTSAVLFRDAASVAFASITTGSTGTTTFGGSGSNGITGGITQTGPLVTGTLAGNSGQVTLTNASNQVAFLGPYTSSSAFSLKDSTGGLTFSGDVVTDGTTTITTPGALDLVTYDLWALNSGSVTNFSQLTLTAVGIAQSATAGTSSIKADTTAFISGTGDIDLLNPDNDFTGTVTLKSTGTFVAVRDANDMTLSTLGGNIGSNTAVKGIAGKTLVLATENLSTGTGYVYLESEAGNLTTTGTISTTTGDITLKSSDAVTGYLLTINHAITSTSAGDILLVGGTIEHNAQDVTTTGAGTISATALTGDLTMVNGTVYSTGSGAITMTAALDIELATVTTIGDVSLTATGGAVIDVLTGETANITGDVVTITAGTGIGTSDGGTTIDDIETTAAELDLTSTTGGIYVNNIGAVQLGNATGGVNTVTSGDIVITATGAITTGSTITTGGGGGKVSISNTADGITLSNAVTADGSGDVTVTAAGALAIDANVATTSGDVALTGAGVTQATATTVNAGSGTVTIDAQASTIDLDGSIVSTGSGTVVTVRDATTVALGAITAAAGTVAIGVDDVSGAVTQNTGLVITADTLTVDTNAAVTLTNTNVIANLGAVTTSGNFALADAGGLTLTGASSAGGTYTITTTGLLDLDGEDITSTGDVSLTSTGLTQAAGSAVNATAATILVDAGGGLITMAGSLVTTSSSSTAVQILDGGGTANSLGTITASSGTVVIGADDTNGGFVQTASTSITAGILTADLNSSLTLSNTGNAIGTLGAVTIDAGGGPVSFTLFDSAGGLTVSGGVAVQGDTSITTSGGLLTITGNITTNANALTLSGTGIDQTGGTITAGVTSISGNGGNVSLEQAGNDFTGVVDISNTGSATTAITDANAIQLGLVTTGTGTLTIDASGDITQNGSGITTGGAVVLDSGTGTITLTTSTNDFGGAVSAANTNGAAIALRDTDDILLGAIGASGNLTVTAVGITQNGDYIQVVGNAAFNAGAGVITLTDPDNDFAGTVALSNTGADNVTIAARSAIDLATSAVGSGTLSVTAVGITQTGAITQAPGAGAATFNGGAAAITLTNAGNDFTGPVAANNSGTNAIQITDTNALALGATTTQDDLTVIAGGAVTQSGDVSVAGGASVTATGFDITLDRAGNAFIGAVSLTGDDVEVKNGNDLVLGPTVATGTYTASAAGDIDQVDVPIAGITSTGLATFTTLTAGKSIRLDNTLNNFGGGVSVGGTSLVDVTVANPLYPLVLDAFNLTGNLVIQALGITQSGPLTVGGTSSFDGGAGAVTINDADNEFTGAVSAQNTSGGISLVDKTAILLGAISTTGTLTVTAVGITQNQPLTVTGTAKFDSGTGNTVLSDANNDFSSAVWLTTSGSGDATVVDKNAIEILVPGVGGNLSVTAGGDITDAGGIFVAGVATFDAGTANVDFDKTFSNFNTVVITLANNVTLFDSDRITFGASTISGVLTVTANGPIAQTGALSVTGTATFDAGPTNDITLGDAGNAFSTVVITNGQDVTLRDTDAIVLGTINVSDTLTVTAVGITQTGAITQAPGAGAATFNGGAAAITLTNAGNDFTGPVAANNTGANAIKLTDAGAMILGAVNTADNLTVVAGGAVTQDTGTALDVDGTASVTATGFDITLTETGNDFGGAVSLTGKNVAVYDSTSLLLGPTISTGTFAATANTGDITQEASPAAGIDAAGTATFTANGTGASIILDNPSNSFAGGVGIVAGDAKNVTIIDTSKSQLILAAISITGNLTIQANGITQTGALAVAGQTSLTSTGGNIELGSPFFNDFDTVTIDAAGTPANVEIADADGITFLASTFGTGSIIIDAESIAQTGAITQDASAGAVSLTSRAGTLVLDDAGNSFTGAVSASTTDGNAITLTNSTEITLGTVTAATGTAATGGDITITANGVNAVGGTDSITTTGDILLQPLSKTTTIGVAGGAGSIQFAQTVFNATITSGASSITIGRADQSGAITVGAVTFRDPTIIRAPAGSVSVNGQITGSDDASITISASPATVTLASDIVTTGNAITIDDGSGGNTAVILLANALLDTTNGGIDVQGAAVTIRGTVTSDAAPNRSLTIKGGTDGDVLVTDTIGTGTGSALSSLVISGNDITLASIDGVTGNTAIAGADGTDPGSLTLTGQTYRTTGAIALSSGAAVNPLQLTGGAAGTTTTITTSGGQVEISGALDLNARNLTIDATGAGAVAVGGNLLVNNTIDGAGALAIDAGTAGVVSVNQLGGSVGATTPLTSLTITNAGEVIIGGDLSAGTLTITDATDYVQVAGVLTLTGGLVTAAQPYDLVFWGGSNGSNSIAGTTTFLNTGDLVLGNQGLGDVFTFVGGVVATDPAAIDLNATIAATTGVITLGDVDTLVTVLGAAAIGGASSDAITLGDVQLNQGAQIVLGAGIANAIQVGAITGTAGAVGEQVTIDTTAAATVTGAVGGGVGFLTITNSGGATFQSTVDAGLVTITDTTGTVTFQGALTATGLTTNSVPYAVAILGDGSTIGGATFVNTGGVTLGDGGDTITFTAGVTSTASTTTINGTVATTGTAAVFGAVTLAGNTVIDAGGGIETQAITGGGFDLQLLSGNSDTSIYGAATGLDTVTLMSNAAAAGLVWFRNSLVATEIVTFAQGYRVQLAESGTTTITNATTFLNTGTLRIGNAGTLATFTGGLDTNSGPSGTTIAGTIATTNTALTLGAAQLFADTTLISGSGAITVGSASTPGGLFLTLGDASQTGSAAITGDASLAFGFLTSAAGGFDLTLGGSSNTIGSGSFLNTGSLTVGTAAGTSTFVNGLVAKAPSAVNLAGVIEAIDAAISLGDVTLLADTTLRAGLGQIGTGAVTDGASSFTLTLGNADQVGDISLGGNLTLDGLVTVAGAYGVQLSGAANDITQAVTFNNTFFVALGANTTDVSLFRGGLSIPGLTGNTFLAGTVRSIGQPITLDNTYLTGNATIDTTNAGNVPSGATITLDGGVLLQGHTLTTIGGSGGSSSTNLVGATNLSDGSLVVESGDLNIGTGSGTPAQVTVTQDTTLEVSAGSLNVSANSTITATGKSLTLLADTITIASSAGSIVAGDVTLAPVTASENIFLGTATGTGLVLGQTAFDAIDADSIQIGQAGNTGDVTMGVLTLVGTTLLVVADGPGGTVIVNGLFTSTGTTASGIGLEITGSGATTVLNADIVSATDVIINDAIEVGAALVTIDTSSGNAAFGQNGGLAGIFATSGETNSLTINAGTGVVTLDSIPAFGDNGGAGSFVNDVTITAGNTTLGAGTSEIAGTFSLLAGTLVLFDNLTAAEIAVSSTAGLTLAGNVVLSAPTGIMLAGPVDDLNGGAFALTANSAGTTTFGGAIGGNLPLLSVTTDAAGTTVLAGGSVKTSGAQAFNDAVTLSVNTTLESSAGGAITLAGAVNAATSGGSSLTVNTAGTTTFGGIVGGVKSLSSVTTDAAGTTAINGGGITTTGNQTFNDPVTLGANTTLTGTLVTLAQLTGNSKNLTVAGDTSLTGQVTGVANLAVSGTALIGADVSTSGSQAYTGLVTLAAGVTLTGTDPSFTAGVAGAGKNLTLDFSGTTAIDGATFTGINDLVSQGGGTTTLTGSLTTTGSQQFADAVELVGATTLDAGSNPITFASTLDSGSGGAKALTVNTTGTTTFGGAVGDAAVLASLTTNAGGTTAINGGSVLTTGAQGYGDAVTLGADTTLFGAGLTFSGTVDGAQALAINNSATTSFGGLVGGTNALTSLTTNSFGTTAINGGGVTTTGAQVYNDPVTLGADATLSGVGISFSDTVNGAQALTVNDSGATTFSGAVGGGTALTSLTTDAGGTTAIDGGSVKTTGGQTYGDAVTLGADTTLTGSTVTFSPSSGVTGGGKSLSIAGAADVQAAIAGVSTLDVTGTSTVAANVSSSGNQTYGDAMTLGFGATLSSTSGTVTLNGVTGGGNSLTVAGKAAVQQAMNGLSTLQITGASTLSANVTSTGTQTYGGAVTLGGDTTLTGVVLTFSSTVDGAKALTVNDSGVTTFSGAVGGLTALASLTTDAGGTTAIDGGSVKTTGGQTYGDAVTLGADTTLTGVAVTFSSTVDGAKALAVNDSGTTTFSAAVGGTTALASLTTDAGGTTAIDGGSVKTTGGQTYGDAVTLGADTTLTGTTPTFASTVTGGGNSLTLDFSGTTSIDGDAVTGIKNLTTVTGGITSLSGGLTTTGSQTFNDAVTLSAATTLDAGANAITFDSTLDGGFALSVNTSGTTTFAGSVGGTTALSSLNTNAGGTTAIDGGSVKTTGAQTYGDAVTLGAATLLETAGGTITFSGTLDATTAGAETLGLTASTGNVVFVGAVGGGTRLGAIMIASAADLTAAAITASSVSHTAGTGTATFNGVQNYDTATGLNVVTNSIVLNQSVTTTNAGIVTLNANNGPLTIAAAGDIVSDDDVTLSGSTGISTAGDVTTTNDDVLYTSETTLTGPIAVNTGSGAGAIAFNGTLDGPHNLTLTAGTDTISFAAAVGGGAALGSLTIQSAASVTAAAAVKLDGGSAGVGANGLTIAAGVNAVDISQPGSSISNFRSIGLRLSGSTLGSTFGGFTIQSNGSQGVYVNPGDYTGTKLVDSAITANAANGIFLNGAVQSLAVATTTISGNGGNGIVFNGSATGVSIDAATVSKNTLSGLRTLPVAVGVDKLAITDSTFTQNGRHGVILASTTDAVLEDTVFSQNAQCGLLLTDGADDTTVRSSTPGSYADATGNVSQGILVMDATNTSISGVNASGNQSSGIYVASTALGTTIDASVMAGNVFAGLVVDATAKNTVATNSLIGFTAAGLPSGNSGNGVILKTTAAGTRLQGNQIGNSKSHGILVTKTDGGQIGGTGVLANTISGNARYGIYATGVLGSALNPLTLSNQVSGNSSGIALVGTTGVVVGSGRVSNNAAVGIYASGSFVDTAISGVSVQANKIGIRLLNAKNIAIDSSSGSTTVSSSSTYNVLAAGDCTGSSISGLISVTGKYGIGLSGATGLELAESYVLNATTAGLYATGTLTGTTVQGNTFSGNGTGLWIEGTGLTVGSGTGTTAADPAGNEISGSLASGILVSGAGAVNNPLLSNSIYGNAGAGISLAGGGNGGQVAPVLSTAAISGVQITITGTMSGTNGDVYRVQFFSSLATDAASGSQVQGRTLLGYEDVTIGPSGSAVVSKAFAKGIIEVNDWIATTATKLSGGTTPSNTSAFSTGIRVT